MTSFSRPTSVPADATLVYPNGSGTPPGWDPQLSAVEQFQYQIGNRNRNSLFNYANAYRDWQANDSQYTALGIQGPPAPKPPVPIVVNVVWANSGGTISDTRQSGDGAWIWES